MRGSNASAGFELSSLRSYPSGFDGLPLAPHSTTSGSAAAPADVDPRQVTRRDRMLEY